ncbi:MAG: hypothetical protein HY980_00520 [Candidatus Magasanikbacteria bacterium]|nr:hypothetical protein [Candidatus Magasanikbacteria bacterium]
MFWHKKKFNWPFVMFGLIALGIVISIAILLVVVADKAKDGVLRTAQSIKSAGEVMQSSSPGVVKAKYKEDLLALRKQAAGEADWGPAFETRFFAMRVPTELLNDHLQAFWDMNKVKENGVDANKQTETLLILDELIKKAEAL